MSSRFLIEVPHDSDRKACTEAVKVFLRTGSHFLTHADWGCKDGDHRAIIVVEVESKNDARNIVPAEFRPAAKIVQLNRFTMEEMERKREKPAT